MKGVVAGLYNLRNIGNSFGVPNAVDPIKRDSSQLGAFFGILNLEYSPIAFDKEVILEKIVIIESKSLRKRLIIFNSYNYIKYSK